MVYNRFSYTLETLIQAGRNGLRIATIPIETNLPTRQSRLFKTNIGYVLRSIKIIVRVYMTYKPLRVFGISAAILLIPGIMLAVRFLLLYLYGNGNGHVQSLIFSAIMIVSAIILSIAGILADLVATNRAVLEDLRARLFALELEISNKNPLIGIKECEVNRRMHDDPSLRSPCPNEECTPHQRSETQADQSLSLQG
jgi:hypothetical protein